MRVILSIIVCLLTLRFRTQGHWSLRLSPFVISLASSNAQKDIHRSLHPLTGSFGAGFTNFVRNPFGGCELQNRRR
jgi:hypothetical protein